MSMFGYDIQFCVKYLIIPYVALWSMSNIFDLGSVLCGLSVDSKLHFCIGMNDILYRSDFRTLTELQSGAFTQLANNAAEGASIAPELTRVELASSKLSILMQTSDLDLAGKELAARRLMMFSDNVRKVARGLQLFNSEVSGVIENIISINAFILRSLENAKSLPPVTTTYSLVGVSRKQGTSREIVLTGHFEEAFDALSSSVQPLIASADNLSKGLRHLYAELQTILRGESGLKSHDAGGTDLESQDPRQAPFVVALGSETPRVKDNLAVLYTCLNDIRHTRAQLESGWKVLVKLDEDLNQLHQRATLSGQGIIWEDEIACVRNGIETLRAVRSKEKMLRDYIGQQRLKLS